jgi:DNA (cytosine-5)-methyltransferase 1
MSKPIKVVDLFAGPGGLGEGFSSLRLNNKRPFNIAVSIEKETSAYRTLELRAVFRQFAPDDVPEAYYAFLRGELGKNPEDMLYNLPEMVEAKEHAQQEALQLTLGEDDPNKQISHALDGDECILIGGPPCQAYSLMGRARNYGAKDKQYSAKDDHRNFLYLEYLKVIARFQPKIFVMENVKGMLSAKVDGQLIFDSIMQDLKDPCKSTNTRPEKNRKREKYEIYSFTPKTGTMEIFDKGSSAEASALEPKDFIIRAEHYGVPQARHRVILLGVRKDIATSLGRFGLVNINTAAPTVEQVTSDLPQLRSKLSKGKDSTADWRETIQGISKKTLKSLSSDDYVPDFVDGLFRKNINAISKSPTNTGSDKGQKKKIFNKNLNEELKNWYQDNRLGQYVINHETRGHIPSDLHRYLYYSTFASVLKESPKSHNLPQVLWPEHKNFNSGKFSDRFRVQLAEKPGTTVTSHISKDGHYYIHYDPLQCRSFAIISINN